MAKKKKKKKSSTTTATVKTKAPTGLAIARSGNSVTFSWKIGDANYSSGQQFCWSINGAKATTKTTLSAGTTSKTVTVDFSKTVTSILFSVRGKRGSYKQKKKKYTPAWSEWSNKTVTIQLPTAPTVGFSLKGADDKFSGTFSWSTPNADSNKFTIYKKYEWESILVNKHNSTSPPSNWKSATRGTGTAVSSSKFFKEDSAIFSNTSYSYTRWFRVRSVGPRGASAWKYSRHTYAMPRQATGTSAKLTRKASSNGYMCTTKWTAPQSFMYPVEHDVVEYAIAKPAVSDNGSSTSYKVTWKAPASLSWTNAGSVGDTGGLDGLTFAIDQNLDEEEVVFVRVNTQHDYDTMPGPEVMASGAVGVLPEITGITITPNSTNHRVSVTATNNSTLESSFIAIYYRTDKKPSQYYCVGILPKGQSQITVQCPNWGSNNVSIGLRAMLADYTKNGSTYSLSKIKMASPSIQWNEGLVPGPPGNLTCTARDSNTIRVTWNWSSWASANQTELSWADHEDAWESTSGPSSFIVDNLYGGVWNISSLATGTWYVRARLLKTDDDGTIYGVWSGTKVVKLSSAPTTPSIVLSDGAVSPAGEVTCYWAYLTTDGTGQSQADICEATYNSSTQKYTYGKPFAKTSTAQHYTISAKTRKWAAGETRYIAVRVISSSGEISEWSTPQAVKIVDPISCQITSTSLVDELVGIGEYINTSDVEIVSGKTYYVRSGDEGSYVYTPVSSPIIDDIGSYFEEVKELRTALTELPLTVTVDGAGRGSKTSISVIRSKPYHIYRPDDSEYDGFEGEAVYVKTFDGDGLFQIKKQDLIGRIDDGASYKIVATVKDNYGQKAEAEKEFVVHWLHQAIIPSGTVRIDDEYDAAIITPLATVPTTVNLIPQSANLKSFNIEVQTISVNYAVDSCTIVNDTNYRNRLGIYNDIHVKPSTTYTLSVYASNVSGQTDLGIGDITENSSRSKWQGIAPYETLTSGRYTKTFTTPEDCSDIRIYFGLLDPESSTSLVTSITLSKIQLEEGSSASEWSPTGEDGDVCDIYRLSVDPPQLIYSGAKFGKTYVDPYPTIGETGGYRLVYRTYNDDYITEDGHIAWFNSSDLETNVDYLDEFTSIIDFGTARVALPYDLSLNHQWKKDFQQTAYLGGHIQGDWNPAVSRSGSLRATGIVASEYGDDEDHEAIDAMRRLAVYPGICHVRTPDGSSYAANVDVTEDREEKWITKLAKYTLDITAVDTDSLDGMTYEEWLASIEDEDEE